MTTRFEEHQQKLQRLRASMTTQSILRLRGIDWFTDYQAREIIARPDTLWALKPGHVIALNPSVRGAKIEDTFLLANDGLHDLTFDARWPHTRVESCLRPEVLQL